MSASPPDKTLPEPVLVIGEALIDLIRRPGEPDDARVGGSPLNVAVGLSRLGVPAMLQTRIGDDEHGALIRDHLADNGVDLAPGSIAGGSTSTAVATIGEDGAATYDFAIDWSLDRTPQGAPRLVHTGSIGAVLEPGASVVAATLHALRGSATISYDPNVRPQLMGARRLARQRIEDRVAMADIVKVSSEDIEWLHPGEDPRDVAAGWLRLGPALVVVTRGAEGAYAVSRCATVTVPAAEADLVDTIGAGDSFMAGLLTALGEADLLGRTRRPYLAAIAEEDLADVVSFAAACSAVTVSRTGANPPRRDELLRH